MSAADYRNMRITKTPVLGTGIEWNISAPGMCWRC